LQWHYVDLENPQDYDRISADPVFFFKQFSQHLIIDEAQELPVLFQVLRGVIDADRDRCGRFILTGSSSPELLNNISESLAGRVAILELGTLKMNEQYQKPLSPFYRLFSQKLDAQWLVQGEAPLSYQQVQTAWLRGGYPEPILKEVDFYRQWMENYFATYLHRDIAQLFPKLNKIAYRRFIYMLAKLSGTILNKSDIARALDVSEGSVRQYLHIAHHTFLWRALPSFEKNQLKAVVKMPKGHIRDTGLLHGLLSIADSETLYNDPVVGRSFEVFVIEELLKGLQSTMATGWSAYYYRTRDGAEIDLIIDGALGCLPIEIKKSSYTPPSKLKALTDFVKTQKNCPFGLLINQSEQARWISPQIYQLPVGWL
jgi:predicted AAA+ superfamily ATPase